MWACMSCVQQAGVGRLTLGPSANNRERGGMDWQEGRNVGNIFFVFGSFDRFLRHILSFSFFKL